MRDAKMFNSNDWQRSPLVVFTWRHKLKSPDVSWISLSLSLSQLMPLGLVVLACLGILWRQVGKHALHKALYSALYNELKLYQA